MLKYYCMSYAESLSSLCCLYDYNIYLSAIMYHETMSFWSCYDILPYSVCVLRGDKSHFDVPAVSQQSLTGLIWTFVDQSSI